MTLIYSCAYIMRVGSDVAVVKVVVIVAAMMVPHTVMRVIMIVHVIMVTVVGVPVKRTPGIPIMWIVTPMP